MTGNVLCKKMREYRDASGRLSFDLSPRDSWYLFRKYSNLIKKEYKGKLTNKLKDVDQNWWDFDINGTIVVLHSDAMAGISIHVEDGSNDKLLRNIAETLMKI